MSQYEILSLDNPGLYGELKVPIGTNECADHILTKFHEPLMDLKIEIEEINPGSTMGSFRKPEFCYGTPATNPEKGLGIMGRNEQLDHVLNLYAQFKVPRSLGRDIIKIMVAKTVMGIYQEQSPDDETVEALSDLEKVLSQGLADLM